MNDFRKHKVIMRFIVVINYENPFRAPFRRIKEVRCNRRVFGYGREVI